MRVRIVALAATLVAAAATGTAHAATASGQTTATGKATAYDFNGDGYADVVTATPKAVVGGHKSAGSLVVSYGSATGTSTARADVLSQSSASVPGVSEAGDRFGAQTASGDVDGDGYDDLVVTAPGEAVTGHANAGAVTILWGGSRGLGKTATALTNTADDPGFGRDAAIGDLDGDGGANLAVLADHKILTYADGISRTAPAAPTAVTGGLADVSAKSLVTGGFTRSGSDGLAVVGSADECDASACPWLGYYTGGPGGITYRSNLSTGAYVASVAAGDINADGFDDLITGQAGLFPDGVDDPSGGAGYVTIRYGHPDGPGKIDTADYSQNTYGVPGTDEAGDGFGSALAVGDMTGDGIDDIAVGTPYETVEGVKKTGSAYVMKGSDYGVDLGTNVRYQSYAGVPGADEADDYFGSDVSLVDANGDGHAELVVAARGEDVRAGSTSDGANWVIPASGGSLSRTGNKSFSADDFGLAFTNRQFGSVLSD
ncbi:FG-GAP repeat protein [Streptomyces sp. AN091965]|uniref:FG-GAP repeat protein n=1 Tax=Streptomyces sp. AN091965 TaxID=2927803 RepID=UPI001F6130C0|nr:FG-GAP repeat protein [Streptomyces sp. AN091965]MCI3928715.1 integrin alpha [Streptomyces sp. AN091965]